MRRIIPRPIKLALRKSVDAVEVLLRQGVDDLMPSKRLRRAVGAVDFEKDGQEYLNYFQRLAKLKPNEKVLDVGCGCGRLAVPLTRYLSSEGSYEGFDVTHASEGIDWCERKIASRYPNFHFKTADIYDERFNPRGKYKSTEYRFPYPDKSFDFVFLLSIFTHLLPEEIEHYLSEIERVLKDDGRCLITFFLLNDESLLLVDKKRGVYNFEHSFDGYRTIDPIHHSAAIAYPEEFIRRLCRQHSLRIVEPIHYGAWSGRQTFLAFQDIVVATKSTPDRIRV